MYRVDRNNFCQDQKNATVYTPPLVSKFLFEMLHDKIDRSGIVPDLCVGAGSLLEPFRPAGFGAIGIHIEDQGYPDTVVCDFVSLGPGEISKPALVEYDIGYRRWVLVSEIKTQGTNKARIQEGKAQQAQGNAIE